MLSSCLLTTGKQNVAKAAPSCESSHDRGFFAPGPIRVR
jgi:hypothetical protein